MNNLHPNAQYIQSVYDAFAHGDMAAVAAAYTDDVVQHFPGHGQFGGDYTGKGAVFGWYGRIFEVSGGTFWIKPQSVVADDERGIAYNNVGAEVNGQRREWTNVEVYKLADGKITDIWTMPLDHYIVNEFWG